MSAVKKIATDKSVLHEILTWSNERPVWQRDALRRIFEKGLLAEADVAELERLCRSVHNIDLSADAAISPASLADKHLPHDPGASESVSLVSIGNLNNVNRLPTSQIMPLGKEIGLTIIFGENGAGKSGYARVIKKACRARGLAPIIRPNAFALLDAGQASAEIVFRVGGANVPIQWQDGVSTDPRLASVFVFDASSASHYVAEDNAASFTPFGLDILPTLSKVCDELAQNLKQDVDQKKATVANRKAGWKDQAETKVGKLISNLSATTKLADIEKLAGLDAAETQRLHDLREAFKVEPLQKAKATRAAKSRLELFSKKNDAATVDLSDAKIADYKKLIDDEKSTAAVAKAFKVGKFDSGYLSGTGTEPWLTLWNAAREYSLKSAYVDQIFPVTTDEVKCVLCQQEVSEEAGKRLVAFEKFATDASQKLAADAVKRLAEQETKINAMELLDGELAKVDSDLAGLTEPQRKSIVDFVAAADSRLRLLKQSFLTKSWTAPSAFAASQDTMLSAILSMLAERAKMEESAHDPEKKNVLMAERHELSARDWLFGVQAEVIAQIETYKEIAKLERCQKDVGTTHITTKNSELTKQFVTEEPLAKP